MMHTAQPRPTGRVITFGTYDLLHVGHLALLERAAALGSTLIVGVSSDELNLSKKGLMPAYPLDHRIRLVRALRCVDEVFVENALELKRRYLMDHRADVLVMGDDWAGRFDEFSDICRVVYLPRTEGISSTEVKAFLRATSERPAGMLPGSISGPVWGGTADQVRREDVRA